MNAPAKAKLVILHGVGGVPSEMEPLAQVLRAKLDVFAPNMPGHGGRPIPQRLTFGAVAADAMEYLDASGVERCFLFGYSSGGTLALYLARRFPERFGGVITLAAKYVFDRRTVRHWTFLANPQFVRRSGVEFEKYLAESVKPYDWVAAAQAIREYVLELGQHPPLSDDDLRVLNVPALVIASNEDQIVPLEESLALGRLIPRCKIVLFHGQCHPLGVVPLDFLARTIEDWMESLPAQVGATSSE